jgi:hypothetical protein
MNSLDTLDAFCSLPLVVPVGSTVDITGGPSDQTNGNSLLLPNYTIIEWTPMASGYTGSKATFLVGSCASPLVASNAFIEVPSQRVASSFWHAGCNEREEGEQLAMQCESVNSKSET